MRTDQPSTDPGPPGELTPRELARYAAGRAFWSILDGTSRVEAAGAPEALQARLKWARVSVVGLGGVGSAVAAALVASGVGEVACTDGGIVDLADLGRQVLYAEPDVGRRKVDAAVERLRSLNSDVELAAFDRAVDGPAALAEVVDGADLFVLCARRPAEIVSWANAVALASGTPWVRSARAGAGFTVGTFVPGRTGCVVCLHTAERVRLEALDLGDLTGDLTGVTRDPAGRPDAAGIAPTAQIAGCYGALEALHLLLGRRAQTAGRLLHGNFLHYDQPYFTEAPRDPDCPACGPGRS